MTGVLGPLGLIHRGSRRRNGGPGSKQWFSLPQTGVFAKRAVRRTDCAHFVLNSNSLQLIPAYSSQSSSLAQTLAAVGLSESE